MPTYRIDEQGQFTPFEQRKAQELEAKVEDWFEANDHVVLGPERVLYIGRQVATDHNKTIDLLAVDSRGQVVVIELKKDRTPREMIAQALEYAAFVKKLDYDGLNSIATSYFATRRTEKSLDSAYFEEFGEGSEPEWNNRQIIVLVGQTIQPEIVDVAQFLRAYDIDLRVLQLVYLESTNDRLVNVETVIGKEQLPSEASRTASGSSSTTEQLLTRTPQVQGIFAELRRQFTRIGLIERQERTTIAYDLRSGEPVINMWPSPAGRVIVLVLGRRIHNLDPLRSAGSDLGLYMKGAKSALSFHLYPKDHDRIADVADLIAEQLSIQLDPLINK